MESSFGEIDAGINAQLVEISRALLESDEIPAGAAVNPGTTPLDGVEARLAGVDPLPLVGRVTRAVGLLIESAGPRAAVGSVCEIVPRTGPPLPVEVVGFRDTITLTVPLGKTSGIEPGDRIVARGGAATVPVGPSLLGRVIDGLGQPLDGRPLRAAGRVPAAPAAAESAGARTGHAAARHRRHARSTGC